MNRRYFRRGTQPTFKCEVCRRRTRNPDSDMTCPDCWQLAGIDNHYNDNRTSPTADELVYYDSIVTRAAKKSSDPDAMRKACPYIWQHRAHTERKAT